MTPLEDANPIIPEQPVQVPPVQSKGSNLFLLILLLLVAAVAGFIGYELGTRKAATNSVETPEIQNPSEERVVCTMDAKVCPDGSSVGRVGPKCEFEACPSGTTSVYEGSNYSFEYPADWSIANNNTDRVVLTKKDSKSSLTVQSYEYQDFVNRLYKKPQTDTLKDQIAEFVSYESSSTANLGDRCPKIDEWIQVDERDLEGYIVPITLNCPLGSAPEAVVWSFIKDGDSLLWINEEDIGQVPATQTVIDTLVFK